MFSAHQRMVNDLKASDAKLLRQNKHEVWQLPNGARITISKTPSDGRALKNFRAQLRRKRREEAAPCPTS